MGLHLDTQIDKKALCDGLLAVLDKYSCGVIVLNNEGNPVLINAAGERLLKSDDGLKLHQDRLSASAAPAQAVIRLIIRKFTEGQMRADHNEMLFLPRPSGRPAYQLLATPLACRDASAAPSLLAFFIFDPLEKQLIRAEQLKLLYGLTKTESKLAILIAQGKSLDECASELKHKISTSRNLLKRVFQKTGTSRQHELTALVLNQTMPLQVNTITTQNVYHLGHDS